MWLVFFFATEVFIFFSDITHVLNTAVELENFKYPLDNLNVRHILMRDSVDENLTMYLDTCVDHIHTVVKSGGRILVHCVAGVSRSASVCIAYLVKYKHKSLKDAHMHVLNRRPCIFPNFNFWQHLTEFEEKVTGKVTVEMLPTIMGPVPSTMLKDAEYRIRIAWMNELMAMFSLHFVILIVQLISIYFFGKD